MRTLIIFCLSIFYLFSLDARENYEQNGNNGQIVAIPSSNDSIDFSSGFDHCHLT